MGGFQSLVFHQLFCQSQFFVLCQISAGSVLQTYIILNDILNYSYIFKLNSSLVKSEITWAFNSSGKYSLYTSAYKYVHLPVIKQPKTLFLTFATYIFLKQLHLFHFYVWLSLKVLLAPFWNFIPLDPEVLYNSLPFFTIFGAVLFFFSLGYSSFFCWSVLISQAVFCALFYFCLWPFLVELSLVQISHLFQHRWLQICVCACDNSEFAPCFPLVSISIWVSYHHIKFDIFQTRFTVFSTRADSFIEIIFCFCWWYSHQIS